MNNDEKIYVYTLYVNIIAYIGLCVVKLLATAWLFRDSG